MKQLIMLMERDDGRPVYRQIELHFASQIASKVLPPGTRLPSVNEVAASIGVNKRTVLQAYQRLVGRGLAEARRGSGTFVADLNRTGAVASIALAGFGADSRQARIASHYVQAVYGGIREEALRRDIDCQWVKLSAETSQVCLEKQSSGCILLATQQASALLLESLETSRLKTVTIGGNDRQTAPMVRGDDAQGMRLLMEHLFELGHRRIAIFYGNPNNYSAHRRLLEFQGAMERADGFLRPSWICDDSAFAGDPRDLDSLLHCWFGSAMPPTAIVAAGENSALATLQALNRIGIRVPDDVSVCGYDDFPSIQEFATPALTVIRQPTAEIGRTAVRNLIALLGGERVAHAVLPVELSVRASTAGAKKG